MKPAANTALNATSSSAGQDTLNRRQALTRLATAAVAIPIVEAIAPDPIAKAVGPAETLVDRLGRWHSDTTSYKRTAMADYAANMTQFGGKLSMPLSQLRQASSRGTPWQFDVVIVGSGYGAAVMAARLAKRLRPGTRLAIIERGKEWVPGTFPDTVSGLIDASRHRLFVNKADVRNRLGLFHVRQFKEITVLSGTGLGGSSLINASVAIRPDVEVFQQPVWPEPLRDRAFLDPYYDLAERELGVQREPEDWTTKMRAQRLAAEKLRDCGAHYEAAALALTRGSSPDCLPIINQHGMRQRACIDCGDCLNGCNVGAKNTLVTNYLPMARAAGAEIYTQVEVHHVTKETDHYTLHACHYPGEDADANSAIPVKITSRIVVLAAGSLGSTEILLRSACAIPVSATLGSRWTGNGDALGFIRRTHNRTGIQGYGAYEENKPRVGPTIQTNITYPERPSLRRRVLIQEGAATRSYANVMSLLMRDLDLSNTQVLLGMGHDGAQGRIGLDDDQASVTWPGLLESDYRKLIRNEFRKIAEAHGGDYKFLRVFGDKMVSVHPLGGCGIGESADTGVVNHKGQVFDAARNDFDAATNAPRVHTGLYVCDGAMLPTSIACNPLLTISALAERTSRLLAVEPEFQDLFF